MNNYSQPQSHREMGSRHYSTRAVGLKSGLKSAPAAGLIAGLKARRIATCALTSIMFFCSGANAELQLNGSAIYEDLGKQQFVAALFVDTLSNNANSIQLEQSPKRMEVRMLNNYSKRRWLNLWMQSISINNDRESFSGSAQAVIDIMRAPQSAPQKGDIIEYVFDPKQGTSVQFNGTELIANYPPAVFNILLRTWIGPIPPSTAFKDQLLGNVVDQDADELLTITKPQSSRIALAASWMAPPEPIVEEPAIPAEPEQVEPIEVPAELPESDLVAETDTEENQAEGDAGSLEPAEEIVDFDVSEALAQRDYTPLVVAQIYKSIRYPNRAAEKNQQGTVRIGLTIDRSGELISAVATQKSTFRMLDQAALKAVNKAAPFPVLPDQMKADTFEVNLPITFRLQ